MKTHFKIIIACCNVEKWIECSIKTLLGQSYKNWSGIIIDDCSTDKTHSIISELIKDSNNVVLVQNEQRQSKIQNYLKAINISQPDDEDVLVFLDGDDWFPDSEVLAYLTSVYESGQTWVTWGSFAEVNGKNPIVFGDYSKLKTVGTHPIPSSGNVRAGWRYSHLKTGKYFLWKNIKDESFRSKVNKEYFPAAIDLAFMFPMIEMAGREHSKHITRLMYIYNNGNRQSFMYSTPKIQRDGYNELIKRAPYSRKTKQELL